MRYLKHAETGEVRQVSHDDDSSFTELTAERLDNGQPVWAQTGRQDPDVATAIVAGIDGIGTSTRALGAGITSSAIIATVNRPGRVTAAVYIPKAAITGADTNTRTLTIVNRGQDGTGTTVIATLALTDGINADAFTATAMTLSGAAANKKVANGDVLTAVSTHIGTGLADPGGRVQVTIDPD
ncbi:MAG: hypothetical protein Q8O56_13885 [Solirubrobacteraceae bacterium]|nr:hypothetical protein [Solirubrobacteraceae bacterium]